MVLIPHISYQLLGFFYSGSSHHTSPTLPLLSNCISPASSMNGSPMHVVPLIPFPLPLALSCLSRMCSMFLNCLQVFFVLVNCLIPGLMSYSLVLVVWPYCMNYSLVSVSSEDTHKHPIDHYLGINARPRSQRQATTQQWLESIQHDYNEIIIH